MSYTKRYYDSIRDSLRFKNDEDYMDQIEYEEWMYYEQFKSNKINLEK